MAIWATEPPTPRERMRRRRRLAFFIIWGLVLLAAVIVFRAVLMPFALAIVIAYVLAPVAARLEQVRIAKWQVPRWVAVLGIYLVLLASLGVFTALGAPRLVREIEALTRETPHLIATIRDEWLPEIDEWIRSTVGIEDAPPLPEPVKPDLSPEPAVEPSAIEIRPVGIDGYELRLPAQGIVIEPQGDGYVIRPQREDDLAPSHGMLDSLTEAFDSITENTEQHAVTFLNAAQGLIRLVVKGIFVFVIMMMLSAYFLATSDRILAFFRALVEPRRQTAFDNLIRRIDQGLSGVVRGQLVICLVNGVASGILFWALELRYWPILALIATVFSLIPIFGSIISTIPVVIIALQQSVPTAVAALVGIVIIHQIEANLLNPKILGDAAQVHPVLIVFALLAGEHLFGIVGAILAVPVLSIVQSLFLHFREVALGVPTPRRSKRPSTQAPQET